MFILILCFVLTQHLVGQDAQVISVQGRVELQSPGQTGWISVLSNQEILPGSTISVGLRSTALIQLPGSQLEISGLTRLTFEELLISAERIQTRLSVPVGRIRAEVQNIEGLQQDFSLRSPVATASVRGTSFSFDGQNVEVSSGSVVLENPVGQNALVRTGETALVMENHSITLPIETYNQQTQVRTLVNPNRDTPLRVVLPTGFTAGLIIRLPDFGGGE
jgi:hypothetical protein